MKFFIVLLAFLFALAESKLYQVVSLFRHGARFPITNYYDANQTQADRGQLTAVGMRMHQTLGKTLRKQYIDNLQFLNKNYNRSQIQVYSTHYNRTIQSVISQLYGLYPTGTGPKMPFVSKQYHIPPFTNKTDNEEQDYSFPNGYQPIPIKFNEKILIQDCKNYGKAQNDNYRLRLSQIVAQNITYFPFLTRIGQIFNIPPSQMNFSKLASIWDVLVCDQFNNRPIPKELSQNDTKNMRHLSDWYHSILWGLDLAKATNTYKFQYMLNVFDSRIKNLQDYPLKWTFMSQHDTDVFPAQLDLNFTSTRCIQQIWSTGKSSALNCQPGPGFAASIIFQLHSDNNKDFYVKIRNNGKYMNLCQKKDIKCDYNDWKNRIKKGFIDVEAFCGQKIQTDQQRNKQSFRISNAQGISQI